MATKKIVEKKTGEKYVSKTAKIKHEKNESKAEMKKEYGKVKSPAKQLAQQPAKSSGTVKKAPAKMKKC